MTSTPPLAVGTGPRVTVRERRVGWLRLSVPSYVIVSSAIAVIALHTLVDLFLAPEPGTAWSDHVVAAALSLLVLALPVVAWRQLRPGARATAALLLGALALEGAALAVADSREGGPGADDWTGFLLAPAGLALLVFGISQLWYTRKRDARRYLRRTIRALAAFLAVYWLLVPVGMALFATHRPREAPTSPDLGRPAAQVTVQTVDGLHLRGRYVASRNGAAVIVFPGSASRAPQARVLVRHGYGVLMLDMRGYADSDGDPNAFGWSATKDVAAGIRFLLGRPDVNDGRIGGLGFSVGGEVMLQAAAENERLAAVVADGAGERSIRESALRGPAGWFSLPAYAVQTAALAVLSGDAPPPSLVDVAPRIAPRPLLLIGAGNDNGGEDLQPRYFRAAKDPKAFWKIPEAGHTGGFAARPAEYAARLNAFFDAALLGE